MLDDKRLGGQRTEAWSILKWLRNPTQYPKLVKAGYCAMWQGYEECLVHYVNAMLVEWQRRGKKNDLLQPYDASLGLEESSDARMPPWLGCESLHSYHRSALLAKLPEHYAQFGWSENGSDYIGSYPWPVNQDGVWVLRWPAALKRPSVAIKLTSATPPSLKKASCVHVHAESAQGTSKKRPRADADAPPPLPTGSRPGPLHGRDMLSAEEQAARPMSRTLTFGRRASPRAMVVLLHGLTDTADGWHGSFAGSWARSLPGVIILVPQSPDECAPQIRTTRLACGMSPAPEARVRRRAPRACTPLHVHSMAAPWADSRCGRCGAYSPHQPGWSCKGDRKYDWLAQPGTDVKADDRRSCARVLQQITLARIAQLDRWLDMHLAEHQLTNDELVLVGFSQGSILATICGARRGVRGVVAMGGVPGQPIYDAAVDDYVGGGWMDWEQLMPVRPAADTKLLLVNGTADCYVNRAKNEQMLRRFEVEWHWDKGLGHEFPESWYGVAKAWLRRLLV